MKNSLTPVVIISRDITVRNQLFFLIQNLCIQLGFGKAVILAGNLDEKSVLEFSRRHTKTVYITTGDSLALVEKIKDVHPKDQILLISKIKTTINQAKKLAIPFFKRQKGDGYDGLCQHLAVILA